MDRSMDKPGHCGLIRNGCNTARCEIRLGSSRLPPSVAQTWATWSPCSLTRRSGSVNSGWNQLMRHPVMSGFRLRADVMKIAAWVIADRGLPMRLLLREHRVESGLIWSRKGLVSGAPARALSSLKGTDKSSPFQG